jgi:hypothetical protein
MIMRLNTVSYAFAILFLAANPLLADKAFADGGSGAVAINTVHVEGGNIYVFGDFTNPDQCSVSSVVVLHSANDREMDRMMSMAMTSIASGKKISMWLNGCGPVPWHPSAPRAVAMSIAK